MSLWELKKGTRSSIVGYAPHSSASLIQRLTDLGFTQDTNVSCLKRSFFNGPMVVQIQDSVYTLDKELASMVLIES